MEIAASPVIGRAARRHPRPDRGGHDLRQDRQGRVRDRLERGRRSARDRRAARVEAGHRPRRIEKLVDDIVAKNPDKVAEAKTNPKADRLVRRPGDEGVRRQGQPAGGQRPAEEEDRRLSTRDSALRRRSRASRHDRNRRATCARTRIIARRRRRARLMRAAARCRESESLGTDSRDFASSRPFETPSSGHCDEKFFRAANFVVRAIIARANARVRCGMRAYTRRCVASRSAQKPVFHRHFCAVG